MGTILPLHSTVHGSAVVRLPEILSLVDTQCLTNDMQVFLRRQRC